MKLVNRNENAKLILSIFVICAMMVFLYSCGGGGGGGGDDSSGTGNVSFSLDLQETGTTHALTFRASSSSESQFKCKTETYEIATIEAQVCDANGNVLAEGGPWDCELRNGTIGDVAAGDGRIVKVSAKDASGKTIFFGKSGPFSVQVDQVTDVGKIYLEIVNHSPDLSPIGNQQINEGELLELVISATDAEADQLLFEIGNKPAGAIFTFEDFGNGTATAKFRWMPSFESSGNYQVTFKVTDNGVPSLSDSEEITISVGNVPLPPVLSPIGNREVDEGELLEFDIDATDPDSLNLRFEMGNKPADADFTFESPGDGTGTATFSWTPDYKAAGNYPLIFKVFDDTPASEGGPLGDFEEITITVGNVCQSPVLDPILPPVGKEGELLEFTVTADDPDLPDDTLTFSCKSDNDYISCEDFFDPSTQVFSWTPGFEDAGNYPVRFIVTDACPDESGPLQDFEDVTITVGNTCRPPVLDPIGAQPAKENEELSFTITGTDPDLPNDTLTYSCVSDSEVIDCEEYFNPITREFNWTPGFGDAGKYGVRFIVTDACPEDESGPLQDSEVVEISVANTNRPPVLNEIGPQSVTEGNTLVFTITASDPDGEPLSFPVPANLPDGAEFTDNGNNTATFTWGTGYPDAQDGPYDVMFEVFDNRLPPLGDSEVVTITVNFGGGDLG